MRSPLSTVFDCTPRLAWELLDLESTIHVSESVSLPEVTALITTYMRIIQHLNTKQDQREEYFSFKMRKLMAQPYVIRCFEEPDIQQIRRKQHQCQLETLTGQLTMHNLTKLLEEHTKQSLNMSRKVQQTCRMNEQNISRRRAERRERKLKHVLNEEEMEEKALQKTQADEAFRVALSQGLTSDTDSYGVKGETKSSRKGVQNRIQGIQSRIQGIQSCIQGIESCIQ